MSIRRRKPTRSHARRPAAPCTVELCEPRVLFSTAPTAWTSAGQGGGGAFFGPSWNPQNPAELVVATDQGEMFHSTDTGTSWSFVNTSKVVAGRLTAAQFSKDPATGAAVLYCLDYSGGASDGSPRPVKSTDDGATWSTLPGWEPGNIGVVGDAWGLAVDPTNANMVLVSSYRKLFASTNGGATFADTGVVEPTTNGLYFGGAYFDGPHVYVAAGNSFYESSDYGQTLAPSTVVGMASGQFIYSLSGSRGTDGVDHLYAVTFSTATEEPYPGININGFPPDDNPSDPTYNLPRGLYSLTVGQPSWSALFANLPANTNPRVVSTSLADPNTVYVAGQTDGGTPVLVKSTDGGQTFASVFNSAGNQNIATGWEGEGGDADWTYGGGANQIAVDPADPNRIAVADNWAVHLSTDGGATWQAAYVAPSSRNPAGSAIAPHRAYVGSGLEVSTAWDVTFVGPHTELADLTDSTNSLSTDGGVTWSKPAYDLASYLRNTTYSVMQAGGVLYAANSSVHDIYQPGRIYDPTIDAGTGRLLRSVDGGATWTQFYNFPAPVVSLTLDPANAGRMYASVVSSTAGGIYVSDDYADGDAATWTRLPAPPRTTGHPLDLAVLSDGTLVASYADDDNGHLLDASGVFILPNGATAWIDRSGRDSALHYYAKGLTIDPTDPSQNTWYVGVENGHGGYGNDMGGLYKTTDRGVTWTRVLVAHGVESTTINPTTGEMYVCTDSNGLYYDADVRVAANPISAVTSFPFFHPLKVEFDPYVSGKIWVASFGWTLATGMEGGTAMPLTLSGSSGADQFYLKQMSASPAALGVWTHSTTGAGSPDQTVPLSSVSSIAVAANGTDASLTVDLSAGPIAVSDISWDGGTAKGPLKVAGDVATDSVALSAGTVTFGTLPITFSNAARLALATSAGGATITQSASVGVPVELDAGSGAVNLTVNGGDFTFDPTSTGTAALAVTDRATFDIAAGTGAGFSIDALGTLSVAAAARAVVDRSTSAATATLLRAASVAVAAGGTLDLTDNDLDLSAQTGQAVTALVARGYGTAASPWTGDGITSSTAAADPQHAMALGVASNNVAGATMVPPAGFDGVTPGLNDVLVRYTRSGDANLDRIVNIADCTRLDAGFIAHLAGWFNGDVNYDGVVDGSDYALVDNAFNLASVSSAPAASPVASPAATAAVAATRIRAAPPPTAQPVWQPDESDDVRRRRHNRHP